MLGKISDPEKKANSSVGTTSEITKSQIRDIDDNTQEDYKLWIQNYARVWQMVDYDKAPLLVKTSRGFTAVFPPLAYGFVGGIIKHGREFIFISDNGERCRCVTIKISKAEGSKLLKTIKNRLRVKAGEEGLRTYANRTQGIV